MSPSFKALDGTRTHLVNQLVFFDEQYPFLRILIYTECQAAIEK